MSQTVAKTRRDERDQAILTERIGGSTLKQIGAGHNMTMEGARLVIVREGAKHLRRVLDDVHEAQSTGDILVLAVPNASAEQRS